MHSFKAPLENIGTIEGHTAAELLSAAADVALVIDQRGVIRDVSFGSNELLKHGFKQWIGTKWIDTVAADSRQKVKDLLSDTTEKSSRPRQVNHLLEDGTNLMVMYSVVPLQERGHVVAVGKDLSSLENMQQKLVNVQCAMERDFARLSQYETRYRVLFQTSAEAILITNADNLKVLEANPVACELLNLSERKLVANNLLRHFKGERKERLENAMTRLKDSGRGTEFELPVDGDRPAIAVALSIFKIDGVAHILIRLQRIKADDEVAQEASEQFGRLSALVENAPDALVVTDKNGVILTANSEFLDLAQLASANMASGESLANWLGRGTVDFSVINNSLREHGSIRLYKTEVRGEFGSKAEVEVSAVNVTDAGFNCLGFSIRNISRRLSAANDDDSTVKPRSNDQLTDLVGRVPLKELVRESTELIEQLCIQAALSRTGNNRASAAEMLGLSRQSLYVKLRLYAMDNEQNE